MFDDSKAKIGKQGETEHIGEFGLGDRNNRGGMVLDILRRENLYCLIYFITSR